MTNMEIPGYHIIIHDNDNLKIFFIKSTFETFQLFRDIRRNKGDIVKVNNIWNQYYKENKNIECYDSKSKGFHIIDKFSIISMERRINES
jgi:hypothetical protein